MPRAALRSECRAATPADILQLGEREEWRELVGVVPEIDEAPCGGDGDALARGEVIERRLELLPRDHVAVGRQPIHQHAPPGVEAHEGNLRKPVHLGERIREREQGRFEVRRHAEGVREGCERARGHPAGRSAPSAGRGGGESWTVRRAKVNRARAMRRTYARAHAKVVLLLTSIA